MALSLIAAVGVACQVEAAADGAPGADAIHSALEAPAAGPSGSERSTTQGFAGAPEHASGAYVPPAPVPLQVDGHGIRGASLPDGKLALTFDDGPGNRTGELSAYLVSQGIAAAFFVNGKNIPGRQAVLAQVVADGHLVANHGQHHADFTLASTNVINEVAETDALIRGLVKDGKFLLRAPFGFWNDGAREALGRSTMTQYLGPIYWNVGGSHTPPAQAADWACWDATNPRTSADCASFYENEIVAKRRGIVLMHDPYGTQNGNTVDMVKLLVPRLKSRGFTFVRVDEVPEIAHLLEVTRHERGQ